VSDARSRSSRPPKERDEPADGDPLSARWAGGPLGFMLRTWRRRRGIPQSVLAARVGVSSKHLSFLETGRARPSREMIDWIACALELWDDERVRLAEAAGFTGGYVSFRVVAEGSREVHADLRATLDALGAPSLAHDRFGTVLTYNEPFARLCAPYVDVESLVGESGGHLLLRTLAAHVENLPEVLGFYVRRLEGEILRGQEVHPRLVKLLEELSSALELAPASRVGPLPFWVPLELREKDGSLRSFRLTTMTLGAPHDIAWRDVRLAILLEGAGRVAAP
jgi:transcriptional regulator with XRE-family HTH domain